MSGPIGAAGVGEPRRRLRRVLVQGYRWRWWIGAFALLAAAVTIWLTHSVGVVLTVACALVVLVIQFTYIASWVRAIDRARETFREGLDADRAAVRAVVDEFFAAFVSGPGVHAGAAALRRLLLPQAVIVRTCGQEPLAYDVESFIAPRVALLEGGDLVGFREWLTEARIDVFGDIAQVWCRYEKSWTQDGVEHHGRGEKSAQLVRTAAGWRISAVVWDDERTPAADLG